MTETQDTSTYQSVSEAEFEKELISYLQNIGGTKQWHYEPSIKTTDALWDNFRAILFRNNQDNLNAPLSDTEFAQVKQEISNLVTPYQAGQFLYGLNGVSQVEVDTDDGRHVFLTVFDQKQVGAGNTVYQIVNQIARPSKIPGKKDRRFDVTLLINGLPIIQIEEKSDTHDVNEALNQMQQYILENQYSDIFATVQILVAMSPLDIRYMANTTAHHFNKAFAFRWQTEKNEMVSDWEQFADYFLSIPMAHRMATDYTILDGTKNKQQLKVMRPYQVYATRAVLDALKGHDFSYSNKENSKIGYVWHTTGSGKTITSFKTAWLASRLPNVDKVVFLVDRIALTSQTLDNYQAYDPDYDPEDKDDQGVVRDTKSTYDLARKLKSRSTGIVITSTQKLARYVGGKLFKDTGQNIVFIVDEAHRSTSGNQFSSIQDAFKRSAWVGYTGTPTFDDKSQGPTTGDIFGNLLHAYTIKHAIADHNVLGFKVDFRNTVARATLEERYLPDRIAEEHPSWSEEQVRRHIDKMTAEEIDAACAKLYDRHLKHIEYVVKDIFDGWENRSANRKYNALLTTHVGGVGASIPMAMLYYQEFRDENLKRRAEGLPILKVAVTFSQDTTNSDTQAETNADLSRAITDYNETFNTSFTMSGIPAYSQDVISRLNRTVADENYLDLVIVVDQLLTGFDAPQLNTLYVDRTLKGASLIQAYSRTNRIDTDDKPFGNIVTYRLPTLNEHLMNEALAIYANEDSALTQGTISDLENSGVLARPFKEQLAQAQQIVEKIANLTQKFTSIPASEKSQENLLGLLGNYNAAVTRLKQYTAIKSADGKTIEGFDYADPLALTHALGMNEEQEKRLTTVLAGELKRKLAKKKNVSFEEIDLTMTHIKDVTVDYDYITELIVKLMNAKHEQVKAQADGNTVQANQAQRVIEETSKKITQEAAASTVPNLADKINRAVSAIVDGSFAFEDKDYPVDTRSAKDVIEKASQVSVNRELLEFRNDWGITDVIGASELKNWLRRHSEGADDLNSTGQLTELVNAGAKSYRELALNPEVQALTPIRYRNKLRAAVKTLADSLIGKL